MFHTNQANNPTIEELQQEDDFVLIENIAHSEIKTFVIDQLTTESKIIKSYMIYQVLMVLIGIFFITRSLVLAFKGVFQPLIFTFTGLAFSLTFLILIHELLHGLALKFTGAPRISFGGYIKKFIFYAEADCHVLNRC